MIIITVDGLNWKYAKEYYNNIFKEQSMRMIKCNVRMFTNKPLFDGGPTAGPTAVGLACMWSGEKIKNFDKNILMAKYDEDNKPYKYIKKDGTPMDMVWNHFDNGKFYIKHQGPNWMDNHKEMFLHYSDIKAKRCPSDELCIFNEAVKKDYDLFWIHSAIIKGGVFMTGCYEQGRIPTLMQYDEIRKDKVFKREVYIFSIRRYVEVIKWLQEMCPNETFIISADHGTMTDIPFTPNQVDEIPIIINKKMDLSPYNYQWDFKQFILDAKEKFNE